MNLLRVQPSGWRLKSVLIFLSAAFTAATMVLSRTAAAPAVGRLHAGKGDQPSYEVIKSTPAPSMKSLKSPSTGTAGIHKLTGISLPPAHIGLAGSSVPQLQKLAQYEQSAGGALANGMMVFTDTPTTTAQAQAHASDMLVRIKAFASYGIKPLVIMEPSTDSGSVVNFSNYRSGAYDSALDAYFSYFKNHGVTDSEMGMWTYFPEANHPEWGPVDLSDFGPNVVRTINIQKQYFPGSLSSIMLDAESYPAGSTSWGDGSYTSLAPFIGSIPAGTLDSFGLQGFPWAPPANQSGMAASYDPSAYLNASLAAEAADRLGTKSIWLNTGTFHAMYANSKQQTVILSPQQRQTMLNGVLNQVKTLQNNGYSVAVNLFSEDKSNTAEATDWSYKSADDQIVLNNFALRLNSLGVPLWLFDD